jgi:dienelactone hydrolase
MRWRCWSSAALALAAALAGCGGSAPSAERSKPNPLPPRLAHLFDYDRDAPLDPRRTGRVDAGAVTADVVSFVAPGGRVPALVVAPRARGPHAGVIFMHGFGGSKLDFLGEAAGVARLGAVAVTIDSPIRRTSDRRALGRLMIRNVIDLRRAIDLLLARDDVDPERIGLVGYSLGAEAAILTAAVENRLATVIVQASPARLDGERRDLDPIRYVAHTAPAELYFQGATLDQSVPPRELQALIAKAPKPVYDRWYDTSHSFEPAANRDQVAWLRDHLGLRGAR